MSSAIGVQPAPPQRVLPCLSLDRVAAERCALDPWTLADEFRLAKYAWRGYAIAVPGLDFGKIDLDRIGKTKLTRLCGLARLLRINFALQYGRPTSHGLAQGNEPKLLNYNDDLTAALNASMDGDEMLALRGGGYDSITDWIPHPQDVSVIIPACFDDEDRDVSGFAWWGLAAFPQTGDVREEAWNKILDAGEEHTMETVPRKLLEAWDSSRRSREYLNAAEHDCDAKYYAHAMLDRFVA